jgi:hypothetical protein
MVLVNIKNEPNFKVKGIYLYSAKTEALSGSDENSLPYKTTVRGFCLSKGTTGFFALD